MTCLVSDFTNERGFGVSFVMKQLKWSVEDNCSLTAAPGRILLQLGTGRARGVLCQHFTCSEHLILGHLFWHCYFKKGKRRWNIFPLALQQKLKLAAGGFLAVGVVGNSTGWSQDVWRASVLPLKNLGGVWCLLCWCESRRCGLRFLSLQWDASLMCKKSKCNHLALPPNSRTNHHGSGS